MREKKGLSGIIAVVLLVLVIIVAVGIIWAFVGPFLSTRLAQAESSADCLTVNLEIEGCSFLYSAVDGNSEYGARVKRNPGYGNLKDMNFIFEYLNITSGEVNTKVVKFGDGSIAERGELLDDELESSVYQFKDNAETGLLSGQEVRSRGYDTIYLTVAAMVGPVNEDSQQACQPTGAKVECVLL